MLFRLGEAEVWIVIGVFLFITVGIPAMAAVPARGFRSRRRERGSS